MLISPEMFKTATGNPTLTGKVQDMTEAMVMMIATTIPEPLLVTYQGIIPPFGKVVTVDVGERIVLKYQVVKSELVAHLRVTAPHLLMCVDTLLDEWEQTGAGGVLVVKRQPPFWLFRHPI